MSNIEQTGNNGKPWEFDGYEFRVTPEGRFVASEILAWLGKKNAKATWTDIKSSHPEFVRLVRTYSFGRGRPAETLDEEGVYQLIMVTAGPLAAEKRKVFADVLAKTRKGDLVDRQEAEKQQRWATQREKARSSVKRLNQTIQEHGGHGDVYPHFANSNNSLVTGQTARQLIENRPGTGNARDRMSPVELAAVNLAQEAEITHIEAEDAQGNAALKRVCNRIVGALLPVVKEIRDPAYKRPPMPPPPAAALPPPRAAQFYDRSQLPWHQQRPEPMPAEKARQLSILPGKDRDEP